MEDNNSEVHETVRLMDKEYHNTRDKYTRCLERFNEFMVSQIETKRDTYKGSLNNKLSTIRQGELN